MSGNGAVVPRPDDALYRKMLSTQGGIMLLVRLHADLADQSVQFLRQMRTLDAFPDPPNVFEPGSRLAVTYDWLERKFGRNNAVRAVIETSGEVLRMYPVAST